MQYGLLGEKLKHSYSCEIHALIADYQYELCELSPDELDAFLRKKDFRAVNVTIPYKQTVIPYLDWISERAEQIGAVNTIVNRDGLLYGYNTDCIGMREALEYAEIKIKGQKVLILGSGGTARTARAVAHEMGASQIMTVSRKEGDGTISYETAKKMHKDAGVLINTTPVGMYMATQGCPIDLSAFPQLNGVFDAIYNPLRTNLVLDANERGIRAIGGLYMLVAQAVYASALFLGKEPVRQLTDITYLRVLNDKQNIALIGMPSCGKSTVGALLARRLGRELVDTDTLIIEKIGMSIADFFARYGEEAFRQVEAEVVQKVSERSGIIVATGGGAILNDRSVRALHRNSNVVFLDRPLDRLLVTKDRPLSSDREAVERLYLERYETYTKAADLRADASGKPREVADFIIRELGLE